MIGSLLQEPLFSSSPLLTLDPNWVGINIECVLLLYEVERNLHCVVASGRYTTCVHLPTTCIQWLLEESFMYDVAG